MLRALALALVALGCADPARPPAMHYRAADDDVPGFVTPDALPLPDRPPSSCGGTRVSLRQQRAEVVLLVDRSGSMAQNDASMSPKWATLVAVLRELLPSIERDVAVGLAMFPLGAGPTDGGVGVSCSAAARVDPAPAFGNASALLAALDAASPGGNTPTYEAIARAAEHFANSPDPLGRRYVLLATDGAPNCNAALDPATCVCVGPADSCAPWRPGARTSCLDDARTVAAIRALAARGIQTFVVGLLGVESLGSVLDAMAVAGGTARDGATRYYSASDRVALTAALRGITTSLLDCRFRLDAPPPDPDLVDVRLGGVSLARDVARRDGWDWSDDAHAEVAFHGPTCDRVRGGSGGKVLEAVFGCPAAVPP